MLKIKPSRIMRAGESHRNMVGWPVRLILAKWLDDSYGVALEVITHEREIYYLASAFYPTVFEAYQDYNKRLH